MCLIFCSEICFGFPFLLLTTVHRHSNVQIMHITNINSHNEFHTKYAVREGLKNIQRGGVYQFCALLAPDADPPHFRPIPSGPPPKCRYSVYTPPKSTAREKILRRNFFETTPKKQKKLQIYSIIRPYLMKNVDPPPILATLFSKVSPAQSIWGGCTLSTRILGGVQIGLAENGGGQHPAPEGRKIGTPPPFGCF